jgi:hypothetical protein
MRLAAPIALTDDARASVQTWIHRGHTAAAVDPDARAHALEAGGGLA